MQNEGFLQVKKKPPTSLSFLKAFKTSFIKLWEDVSVESLAQNSNCTLANIASVLICH